MDRRTVRLIEENARAHERTARRSGTPEENLLVWTALVRQQVAWDLARGLSQEDRRKRRG